MKMKIANVLTLVRVVQGKEARKVQKEMENPVKSFLYMNSKFAKFVKLVSIA